MENMFKLFKDDCLEIMKKIPDGSIDLVLTDPPYGMSFQSNHAKSGPRYDKIKGDDKVDPRFIKEAYRILKNDGGALLTFCDWKTSCEWRYHIEESGFNLKSQVIWNRLHHGMGDLRGAFGPMHDIIWYGVKGRRIFKNKRPKSVYEAKRPSPSEDNGHPTCKPLELIESLIRDTDDGSNGIILDCFMGSGTTGVAAMNLGRKFIGIEIDDKYFDIAKDRIEKSFEMTQILS